jgi:hypothetical protein
MRLDLRAREVRPHLHGIAGTHAAASARHHAAATHAAADATTAAETAAAEAAKSGAELREGVADARQRQRRYRKGDKNRPAGFPAQEATSLLNGSLISGAPCVA